MNGASADVAAPPAPAAQTSPSPASRVRAGGKFLCVDSRKLHVCGVTYGTFRPDADGHEFHDRQRVAQDFAMMATCGVNAVRVYTVPPRWLLDEAQRFDLRVMVGLPWEQHITFLDDRRRRREIEHRLAAEVRTCAGHPAVLCYAVGNEIPSPIVRWYGRRRVERFLSRLGELAKSEDPGALVTYVNYPSTEFLELPFADLFCFNVYLEEQSRLSAYLGRLQNLAGDRPLVLAELGLDSRRNGLERQATVLDWQLRTAFASGCAGAFVFAWTDEWYRGGFDIEDWDFGLTTRERQPKPALRVVQAAFSEVPFPPQIKWPRISVIVCSYNGRRTIRDCFEGLTRLEYPDFEVIVVDDGSQDGTADIARDFGFRVISTENRGLSSARNTGWQAATGEIVAYLDDDAWPDRHWLRHLAHTFMKSDHAAVGGPNILPAGSSLIAQCVDNSPGGPVHVLHDDEHAEHVPGCNMAFRRSRLEAIGGFDAAFRVAGDDVDVCWRIEERGWTIGFSPAAMVWHRSRDTIGAYWRQQRGYGRAEALLERKWPEKYNALAHAKWRGHIYGRGLTHLLGGNGRIYHGLWGSAPFQTLHKPRPHLFNLLPTMPEWFFVVVALALISALGLVWPDLLWSLPLLGAAVAISFLQAFQSAYDGVYESARQSIQTRWRLWGITALLHLLQPLARLYGRLSYGLMPGRSPLPAEPTWPWCQTAWLWTETWREPVAQLEQLCRSMREEGAVVAHGGEYARWDIEVRGGILVNARVLMAVEEHGAGKQLFRFRLWPHLVFEAVVAIALFTSLAIGAALDGAWLAMAALGGLALVVVGKSLHESWRALSCVRRAVRLATSVADSSRDPAKPR